MKTVQLKMKFNMRKEPLNMGLKCKDIKSIISLLTILVKMLRSEVIRIQKYQEQFTSKLFKKYLDFDFNYKLRKVFSEKIERFEFCITTFDKFITENDMFDINVDSDKFTYSTITDVLIHDLLDAISITSDYLLLDILEYTEPDDEYGAELIAEELCFLMCFQEQLRDAKKL